MDLFQRTPKPGRRILQTMASTPWLIREENLRLMVNIALRNQSDVVAALIKAEERHRELDALQTQPLSPMQGSYNAQVRNGVCVIECIGPIMRYASLFSMMSGATSVQTMAMDFTQAIQDEQVKAILFYFDSPGGEVAGISEFASQIRDARGTKPIWAYVGQDCCSAAYWFASATDRIVTAETAVLGSIGCIAMVPDPKARDDGMLEIVSSQSPNKRTNPNTKEGKAQLQNMVDALADVFIRQVAVNRGIEPEAVIQDYGEGGVFVGQNAVEAGMADALGSFEGCMTELSGQTPEATAVVDVEPETPVSVPVDVPDDTPDEQNTPASKPAGRNAMSVLDKLASVLGLSPEETQAALRTELAATVNPVVDQPVAPAVQAPAATSTGNPAIDEEVAKWRARAEASDRRANELLVERIQTEAVAFFQAQLHDSKVFPPEKESVIRQFTQAALDDLALGAIKAPDGSVTSRVEQIKAGYAARPPHLLSTEAVAPELVAFLQRRETPKQNDPTAPADKATVDDLIARTASGRKYLAVNGTGKEAH